MTSDRLGCPPDRLIAGDCLEHFPGLEAGSIDLVFADPPFNIGYDYDVYDDRRDSAHYLDWTRKPMRSTWSTTASKAS